jgi:hypothetical protein
VAVGTGAKVLSNLPAQPFVINPELFFQLTEKQEDTYDTKPWPGFGSPITSTIPKADILAGLTIVFEGTVTGATAGTVDPLWAYKILKEIRFAGSGKSDLHSASGLDFHVLRFIRNPALNRGVEFYTTTPDENGNFRVAWDVPVASDMTSLVGAMWAQSQQSQLNLELRTATLAELDITGPAVITGNFKIARLAFTAPYEPGETGRIVIPDLSRLHGVIARDIPFNNTGNVDAGLDRLQAIMMRALSYVDLGSASGAASPVDYTVVNPAIEAVRFRFGAKRSPLEYEPAWLLAKKNAEDYGSMLPKGYLAMDFVRQNAARDTVILPGITDPALRHTVRAGTVLAQNSKVHLVQEIQYIG